ncbi:MAG: aminotransferase class V-fold PLP-dependent enzyme [Gammaproteobacteria bacterium]|nr:aminotransferase class V-fold PLP-dependent enzyme [Gammaproteobacteria bacterium]
MKATRREFIGSVSAAAVLTPPRPASPAVANDDPLGVRGDFPVVEEEVVYLDCAYIAPSPVPVVEAVRGFLDAKIRSPLSLGAMVDESHAARRKFARLVGAAESEVALLYSTSEGENIVARSLDLRPGDNVVIDDLHFQTTYVLYQHLAETSGIEVRVVPSSGGAAPVDAFAELIDDRTRLVSVAWVSNQNGYQQDLAGLADLAHDRGTYLYADAVQGIGMLDLDVKAAGIDFFTTGTYKWLLAGHGVAPFYVREELLDLVAPDRYGHLHVAEDLGDYQYRLHDDARKYEYATLAFEAVYMLSAALDYLLRIGVKNIERHTVGLAHRLQEGLTAQGHDVWTPPGNRSAIVAFEHHRDNAMVRRSLMEARVNVSLREGGAHVRASPALFNNAAEIDALLDVTGGWA